MKRLVLLVVGIMICSMALAQDLGPYINAPLPQFINPFFDGFSHNYLGAASLGRANTGMGLTGGVESILLNPASYDPDKSEVAVELMIKPPVDVEGYQQEARYSSPNPLAVLGLGFPISNTLSGTVIYSQPKSLYLDSFSFEMHGGAYWLMRYPKYYLHQFSGNLAYHSQNLHLGVSLHNQLHVLDDVPLIRSFERISDTKYIPRVEIGALYTGESGNIGLSFIPPSDANWDLKYKQYDSLLPLKMSVGTSFFENSRTWLLDLDYEQYSALHSEFKDRLRIKAGFEIERRNTTYRLGYCFSPEVYHGDYSILLNTTANADTSNVWDDVPLIMGVDTNTQHFLSAGLSYQHKIGSINIGLMQSLVGKAPLTQISLGLSIFLDVLRKQPVGETDETESQHPKDRHL